MLRHSPWLALLHLVVLEGVQAAGVLEGGARGDGGGTVAGEREEVARDPGARAAYVSSRRVSSLPQVPRLTPLPHSHHALVVATPCLCAPGRRMATERAQESPPPIPSAWASVQIRRGRP
jgi:hypothetical protein